ncbi:MAG TPA: TIGR03067 domain-containing protein [Gemmatimonadaceae bacterium]
MTHDLDWLQGTWNIVALEIEGQKFPPGGSSIAIDGDAFVSRNMGAVYEGTVRLDETRAPKTFDLIFAKGPEAGGVGLGIYELDGDTWTICLGFAGKSRPTEFRAPKGTGYALETLKRETNRSASGRQSDAAHHGPLDPALEGEWAMVSCTQDGQPMDPGFVMSARRCFHGTDTELLVGKKTYTTSRCTTDPARDPKEIAYPDLKQHGIYSVAGATLRTALAPVADQRPRDFAGRPGDGHTVSEWRR